MIDNGNDNDINTNGCKYGSFNRARQLRHRKDKPKAETDSYQCIGQDRKIAKEPGQCVAQGVARATIHQRPLQK